VAGLLFVAGSAAWVFAACVGQLQFDPASSGIVSGAGGSSSPGGGSGGATGGSTAGTGGAAADSDAGAQDVATPASCPAGFDVLTTVFKDKCGGCHGAAAPTKNLDLVTAGLGARTVGVVSTCNNKPLVSTTLVNGEAVGHLLDKLAGPVTGCGVQMPAGGTPLSSVEIACVKEWALKAVQTANGGQYP
jgi:hypothetical protein